ncbi:MAG TPA: M20 family metallopeptidase [Clostridia bacterium]|nr:M20 family metallopeptidase [Clostridia bacterium]
MLEPLALMKQSAPYAIELRRILHRHPELAFQEKETSALIRRELTSYGAELLDGLIPTGVVAKIRGGCSGRTILVREDIDALPMRECTGLEFSSQEDGVCHSCGHDIHTASLLLLAKTLCEAKSKLSGDVLLVFQPAEETASGAKAMFAAGLGQDETSYDEVIGFHVDPLFSSGTIGLIKGPANASTDLVRITVHSQGGHGAHPYRCADPVATAGYLLAQLQTVVSRENPALQPAVLTFGMIHGGTAPNIIPTQVEMTGTLRAFNEEGRHAIWEAIRRMTEYGATAMRATATTEIEEGVPVLINDPAIVDGISAAAQKLLGESGVVFLEQPSPGSDDFSCYLNQAPGVQFRVGTNNGEACTKLGIHNPENIFDEESIYISSAVMLQYILDKLG